MSSLLRARNVLLDAMAFVETYIARTQGIPEVVVPGATGLGSAA